ncbi:jg2166 [Pararge aegeria aegeria]|uniref:Jg2166 protein n=1 Tax=Pararge aegeria aegeria TaxID=348720 RepID=A0A8S4R575_9NEOP|nr:jg2166 [Pararge aegeria aegeria]
MGDFNAKIGKAKPGESLIIHKYGYGTRNKRGEALIDFAHEKNLPILNTFFKKKEKRKWTWRSPDGSTKNEIDFILSNLKNSISNIEIIDLLFSSDHRLVRATVRLQIPKKSRKNYNNKPKSLLVREDEITRYLDHLNTYTKTLTESQENSVQVFYDKIIHTINTSQQYAHIPSKQLKNEIIQERTMVLLKRKYELQKTKPKTRAMKNELSALYKLTSKYLKCDYDEHRSKTIEKHLERTGSMKKAYKELRTYKNWITSLQDSTNMVRNRLDILKIATAFYKDLFSEKDVNDDMDPSTIQYIEPCTKASPPFDNLEVLKAIKRLKNDKSPDGHCPKTMDRIYNHTTL